MVQSFKQAIKAARSGGRSLSHRLANFLLTYRTTPHATTGKSPSQLFMGRQIRTRFDLLIPDCGRHVLERQAQQKSSHDRAHSRNCQWFVGQRVMARNLRPGPDWVPATILEVQGPVTYLVETDDKQVWKRHLDQLKEFEERRQTPEVSSEDSEFPSVPLSPEPELPTAESELPELAADSPELESNDQDVSQSSDTATSRYPSRDRHPPDRFM